MNELNINNIDINPIFMDEINVQLNFFHFSMPEVLIPETQFIDEIVIVPAQEEIEVTPVSTYRRANRLQRISKALAGMGAGLMVLYFTPSVIAQVQGPQEAFVPAKIVATQGSVSTKNLNYQPAHNSKLPLGAKIKIPKIGLNTTILEASYDDHENALRKGVWRSDDSGTPYDREKPTILAAHRYGYLAWSNSYRRENSFFNLPKLNVGDVVEVTWRQRKYTYEVYKAEESTEITDYSADLILYTCRDLNSDTKIFRYARILEI